MAGLCFNEIPHNAAQINYTFCDGVPPNSIAEMQSAKIIGGPAGALDAVGQISINRMLPLEHICSHSHVLQLFSQLRDY